MLDAFEHKLANIKQNSVQYVTNFFEPVSEWGKWSRKGVDVIYESLDVLIWARHETKCSRLYFAGDIDSLKRSIALCIFEKYSSLAIDIIGKEVDLAKISQLFMHDIFYKRTKLLRLALNLKKDEGKCVVCSNTADNQTLYMNGNDIMQMEEMFSLDFDCCADQLPNREDILEAIKRKEIIVERGYDGIKGFVWFEKKKLTSLIRYWCVGREFRGVGIGSLLMRKYFDLTSECCRHLLWVKEENQNALVRYSHYGYRPDGLEDLVLMWRNNK